MSCQDFYLLCFVSQQSKKAIKNIIQKCTYLPALEPFLYDAPPNILKYVAGQFSKVRNSHSLGKGRTRTISVSLLV